MNDTIQILKDIIWLRVAPIVCFFKDHDIQIGYPESYEPEYCARCLRSQDQKDLVEGTLPHFMFQLNYWLVENVGVYDRFHCWMLEHHPRQMPGWMEY